MAEPHRPDPHRLLVGAHVEPTDPISAAAERSADLVQFFLGDPQGWDEPVVAYAGGVEGLRADAAAAGVTLYVHAPYRLNLASTNNRIRIPSRKLLQQHADMAAAVGAAGIVVHGGHVTADTDEQVGFDNWRKAFEHLQAPLPVLIENTAGGDHAMARRLDAIARLWDALDGMDVGFCLDTCHAWAGGIELLDVVDRVKAITGRIDLVHANDSKDPFDSGRDRHENFGTGAIDPAELVAVVAAAGAPVVCETPGGASGQGADIAFLRGQLPG
jgi:deoxyribonuclease IV